jgi:hypothetical protein
LPSALASETLILIAMAKLSVQNLTMAVNY